MPADPADMISFWDTCDNMWATYQVPKDVQAKLLLPLLTPRAKMLVSRLSAEDLGDIGKIRDFLTVEFKLTPREYRAATFVRQLELQKKHTLRSERV